MRNPLILFILITVLIFIDFYIYHVLRILLQGSSQGTKSSVGIIYWALCIMSLSSFLLFPYISNPYFKQYIFSIGIGWVLTQIFMVLFFLMLNNVLMLFAAGTIKSSSPFCMAAGELLIPLNGLKPLSEKFNAAAR